MNKILTILALMMLLIVPMTLGRAVEKQIATPVEFSGASSGSFTSSSAIRVHFADGWNQQLCERTNGILLNLFGILVNVHKGWRLLINVFCVVTITLSSRQPFLYFSISYICFLSDL